MSEITAVPQPPRAVGRDHRHSQISAIGWGVLLVWIGIAILLQIGWGWGLVGVGVIILGSQGVHQMAGDARLDWFSTLCGVVFLAGGIWELFSISVGLVPVLCIAAGAVLVLSALTRRPAG